MQFSNPTDLYDSHIDPYVNTSQSVELSHDMPDPSEEQTYQENNFYYVLLSETRNNPSVAPDYTTAYKQGRKPEHWEEDAYENCSKNVSNNRRRIQSYDDNTNGGHQLNMDNKPKRYNQSCNENYNQETREHESYVSKAKCHYSHASNVYNNINITILNDI